MSPPQKNVDLLDIDIEGFDDLIIQEIDWSTFKPRVVLAEMALSDDGINPNGILCDNGYTLIAATKRTGIYCIK